MSWEKARHEFTPHATALRTARARLPGLRAESDILRERTTPRFLSDSEDKPGLAAYQLVDLSQIVGQLTELHDKCADQSISQTLNWLEYLPLYSERPGQENFSACLEILEPFIKDGLALSCSFLNQAVLNLANALNDYPQFMWPGREPGEHPDDREIRLHGDEVLSLVTGLTSALTGFSELVNRERNGAPASVADTKWGYQNLRDYADQYEFDLLVIKGDDANGYKYDLGASRVAYSYLAETAEGLAHVEAILEWAASVNLSMKTQYHGTGRKPAEMIVDEGFRDKGSKTGRAFGDGAYTTPDAATAGRYANNNIYGLGYDREGSIVVGKYQGGNVLKYRMTDHDAEFYTSSKIPATTRHALHTKDDVEVANYAATHGYDAIYYKNLRYLITRNRANVRVLMRIDPTNPTHPYHREWLAKVQVTGARIAESAATTGAVLKQPPADPARNLFGYNHRSPAPEPGQRGLAMRAEYHGEEHGTKWASLSAIERRGQAGRVATWYWDDLTRDQLQAKTTEQGRLVDRDGYLVSGRFGFVEALNGRVYLFDQKQLRVFRPGEVEPEIITFANDHELWSILDSMRGDWYIQCLNHSSPVAGANVTFAGEVLITDGLIKLVTPLSGHYQPAGADTYNWLAGRVHDGDDGLAAGGGFRGGTNIELLDDQAPDMNRASRVTLRADQMLGTGTFGRPEKPGDDPKLTTQVAAPYSVVNERRSVLADLADATTAQRERADRSALVSEGRPAARSPESEEESGQDDSDTVYSGTVYSDDE